MRHRYITTDDEVFEQGWRAARDGHKATDCPYHTTRQLAHIDKAVREDHGKAWRQGWGAYWRGQPCTPRS